MHRLRLLAIAAASALALTAAARADDFMPDPIYGSPMFDFEGFYAGVLAGGATLPGPGLVGSAGLVAGANFTLSESFLAGLEFQGEGLFNGGGVVGWNGLVLGHFGGYLTQDLMAYAAVGAGLVDNGGAYVFGAGIEGPIAGQVSARGEILGTGAWGAGPSGAKATVGLLWHMN